MEKLVYLLGDTEAGQLPRARSDLRDALLEAAPTLRERGASRLCFTVADLDDPVADSVSQFNVYGLLDAKLSFWIDSLDDRAPVEEVIARLSSRHAGYLVTESEPRRWAERNWAAGTRSPAVCLVTSFGKPEALDDERFFARWHGSHTPLSLEIHPLLEYVRNAVVRSLTPGAPPIRAIVNEAVESAEVAADPVRFYRSAEDQKRAVRDLLSFVDFETLSTVLMSEFILDD